MHVADSSLESTADLGCGAGPASYRATSAPASSFGTWLLFIPRPLHWRGYRGPGGMMSTLSANVRRKNIPWPTPEDKLFPHHESNFTFIRCRPATQLHGCRIGAKAVSCLYRSRSSRGMAESRGSAHGRGAFAKPPTFRVAEALARSRGIRRAPWRLGETGRSPALHPC